MPDSQSGGAERKAKPATFPRPIRLGGRNYWRLGELRRYVAQAAGESSPSSQADDEHLLTAAAVRRRLGGVSAMWIHRRLNETRSAPTQELEASSLEAP